MTDITRGRRYCMKRSESKLYHKLAVIILCLFMLVVMAACRKDTAGDGINDKVGNISDNSADNIRNDTSGNTADDDSANGSSNDILGENDSANGPANNTVGTNGSGNGSSDNTTGGNDSGNSSSDNTAGDNGGGNGSSDNTAGEIGGGNDEMSELMRLYTLTLEGMKPLESLDIPMDSSEFSAQLASEALSLCSQGTKQMTTKLLTSSGFEILLQAGYDKDKSDPSHTCAFTLAKKVIALNGKDRDLLLISIRGTDSGEWFSNFDFAASHSDDTAFAENFLQAAQDVYVRSLPTLLEYPDAVMLVCGHSRGAACANLLGMTLDDLRSKENVYVYTFATPGTVRGGYDEEKYTNIFNLINPADLVTYLPIAGWGYHRVGNDLILAGDRDIAAGLKGDMELLAAFVPTISDYYGKKYKIDGLEGFEDGITAYETMLALASSMTGIECEDVKGLKVTDIYRLTGSDGVSGGLYPLINFLKNMVGTDGNMNVNVFKQHMPAVYQELIAELGD